MKSAQSFNRLLVLTFLFVTILIIARISYTGTWRHIFLLWNIFLAWIPFVLSKYFSVYQYKSTWKQLFLFGSWLLFFPNALYIVTDLVHLQENGAAPLWYDVVVLFTSSLLGLAFGYGSLFYAEEYLLFKFGKKALSWSMPLLLFLGSFGVYLGRFERWNSWDIVHNPLDLAENIFMHVFSPVDHIRTWAVTVTLTVLFYLLYCFMKMIPQRK